MEGSTFIWWQAGSGKQTQQTWQVRGRQAKIQKLLEIKRNLPLYIRQIRQSENTWKAKTVYNRVPLQELLPLKCACQELIHQNRIAGPSPCKPIWELWPPMHPLQPQILCVSFEGGGPTKAPKRESDAWEEEEGVGAGVTVTQSD